MYRVSAHPYVQVAPDCKLRDDWGMTACIVFKLTPMCKSSLHVSRPYIYGTVTNLDYFGFSDDTEE